MKIPTPQHTLAKAIYALHEETEAREQAPRAYLGCSSLGNPCERALWLSFRWVMARTFDGRILRLLNTGHREEARVLEELKSIRGITVVDRDPNDATQQLSVDLGCHVRGHLDAEVLGLPEAPKSWHVFDVKTIRAKKFDELVKGSFTRLFPQYHAQGTLYMGARGRERAAFLFVCKDDDRLHLERFEFDRAFFKRLMDKARRIALSLRVPEPLVSAAPEYYACKLCDLRPACSAARDTYAPPARNCRTCHHVTPKEDGTWVCELNGAEDPIPLEFQRVGCAEYTVHRDLRDDKAVQRMSAKTVAARAPWQKRRK